MKNIINNINDLNSNLKTNKILKKINNYDDGNSQNEDDEDEEDENYSTVHDEYQHHIEPLSARYQQTDSNNTTNTLNNNEDDDDDEYIVENFEQTYSIEPETNDTKIIYTNSLNGGGVKNEQEKRGEYGDHSHQDDSSRYKNKSNETNSSSSASSLSIGIGYTPSSSRSTTCSISPNTVNNSTIPNTTPSTTKSSISSIAKEYYYPSNSGFPSRPNNNNIITIGSNLDTNNRPHNYPTTTTTLGMFFFKYFKCY